MILVDSSVWIAHLRVTDERLVALLQEGEVLGHPFVVGELALGNLQPRDAVLADLQQLPQATLVADEEVLDLINRQSLFGRGIGYVDAHLLASVRLTLDARLWTYDRRLHEVATDLSLTAAMLSH
ncbi:MAG: type II toxin-antitoxin system VapC family toxin [Alphaproteobacteria bacterium]